MNFALGVDCFFKVSKRMVEKIVTEQGRKGKETLEEFGGILFGVRIGYVWMPVASDWSLDGVDVYKGPKMDLSGFYVKVVIGGGGGEKCFQKSGSRRCP